MTNDPGAPRPPLWYWLVAVAALLWGGFLLYSLTSVLRSPGVYTLLFTITAVAGMFGAVAMLLRRRWAVPVMLISLAAALVQHGMFFATAPVDLLTGPILIIPALVLVLGFLFAFTARTAARRGWLR